MTDREQVEALAYALMAQQQCDEDGVMCIVSRKAATEAADTLCALLRERDAAEALAYERAAEMVAGHIAPDMAEESAARFVLEESIKAVRALTLSPNALAEHDAKVRAEERERAARIAGLIAEEWRQTALASSEGGYEEQAVTCFARARTASSIAAAIREQDND